LGNPVSAASELLNDLGVETLLFGFSILPSEQGATQSYCPRRLFRQHAQNAIFCGERNELAAVLAGIVCSERIVRKLQWGRRRLRTV
jgi:hypothetical protein